MPRTGPALPAILVTPSTVHGKAKYKYVSDNRADTDSRGFNHPDYEATVSQPLQLPFKAGDVWRVVQGYDDGASSHNGFAAFSYDFALVPDNPHYPWLSYPYSTAYAPIYSTCASQSINYTLNGPLVDGREPNKVHAQVYKGKDGKGDDVYAQNEFLEYLHLAPYSITNSITNGVCDPNTFICTGMPVSIQKGEILANDGPGAAHLHFSALNTLDKKKQVTIPVAFEKYNYSEDNGATWHYVFRGYPKDDQWIKRAD